MDDEIGPDGFFNRKRRRRVNISPARPVPAVLAPEPTQPRYPRPSRIRNVIGWGTLAVIGLWAYRSCSDNNGDVQSRHGDIPGPTATTSLGGAGAPAPAIPAVTGSNAETLWRPITDPALRTLTAAAVVEAAEHPAPVEATRAAEATPLCVLLDRDEKYMTVRCRGTSGTFSRDLENLEILTAARETLEVGLSFFVKSGVRVENDGPYIFWISRFEMLTRDAAQQRTRVSNTTAQPIDAVSVVDELGRGHQ